jgi:phosphoglycerate dehydrogenase-like enzyme
MIHIAILDDYQNASLAMADWSPLAGRAEITVFNDHLSNFDKVVERLLPFDVVCVMRERTPLPRSVIERLPRLKLIASTGSRRVRHRTLPADHPFRSLDNVLSTPHIVTLPETSTGFSLAIRSRISRDGWPNGPERCVTLRHRSRYTARRSL